MGKLGNYLRTYRRRGLLTQAELAFLIGYNTESIISRLERSERTITLAVAFACQTIFGVEPTELFPTALESAEKSVLARIRQLHDRLMQSNPTQKTLAKLELLQNALDRFPSLPGQEV